MTAEEVLASDLQGLEAQFFPLFQNAAVGFAKVGLNCDWLRVNQKLCDITGYSEAELLAMTFVDITHPEDVEADLTNMQQVMSGKLDINVMEKRYLCKDGSVVWVQLTATLVRKATGEPDYFIVVIEDIDQRKQAELALKTSEERSRLVLQATNDGVWDLDLRTGKAVWNDRFFELLGLSKNDYQPEMESFLKLIHPEDQQRVRTLLEAHLADPEVKYVIEYRIRHSSGHYIHMLAKAEASRDKHGVPFRMVGSNIDITELKQTQEALKTSEERFRLVLEGSQDGIWDWDMQTGETYWSDRFYEIIGLQRETCLADADLGWSLIHSEDRPLVENRMNRHIQENTPYELEFRFRHAEGHYVILFARGQVTKDSKGQPSRFLGLVTDISRRKEAEEKVRESEARFRMMADASPLIIWVENEHFEAVYANTAWLTFTGKAQTDNIEQTWKEAIHPDDFDFVMKLITEKRNDRAPYKLEYRMRRYDGEYRWMSDTGTPRFNSDGSFAGYIGGCYDVTELKQAQEELRNYARRLEQSNKELEQFATVASHDLQAPLRKVMMFTDHIENTDATKLSEEGRDALQRVKAATRRMQHLISDLLSLSRITRRGQAFKKVELSGIFEEVLKDFDYLLQESGAQLDVGKLPMVEADAQQIKELFSHLLENALKFRRVTGKTMISISAVYPDETHCSIVVEDNGIGFEPRHAERIFGIFERLHGQHDYEGTGMGLAICRKIVERHNGIITAESTAGKGSRFVVTLPLRQPMGEH